MIERGRRAFACLVIALLLSVAAWFVGPASAQEPIKIGLGEALTGPLSGAGKASLLGLKMWRDDVNAKGGLLGRKIELIFYDDQSKADTVPGIYTKLLDVDKVDLIVAPYATVPTAPLMPLAKQRGLLVMGNFSFQVNHTVKHDMWFNNLPFGDAKTWVNGFFSLGKKQGAKTIAFIAADQEFAQNLANGAKELANQAGLQTVYSQNYPPTTVDFTSMIQAIRSAKPDLVFVCSYPNDSVAIVRAVNEIGVGDNVKIFGGAMVGLQYAAIMESLGSMLNGIVNYNSYVPEKTMETPGIKDFLARYQKLAPDEKVDPLGFYLPPYSYSIGQMLAQAITATKSIDQKTLAAYIHTHEMHTIVGPISYNPDGEWAHPVVPMIQFRGVADKNLDQFRAPGKQVILDPPKYKTGDLVAPFERARKS